MISSPSVIRRYTPPTCTLEILAKSSSLSRWTGKTLLKDLRFKLSFDDPKVSEEKQANITGDRAQLQQLTDVVSNYVQKLLTTSPYHLPLESIRISDSSPAEELKPATDSEIPPSITTKGLLAHELSFGSLAHPDSPQKITITASQLFDLATALDEYNQEIDSLPNFASQNQNRSKIAWGSMAAALVASVGVTALGLQVYKQNQTKPNTLASIKPQTSQVNPDVIGEVIPPVVSTPSTTLTPSPTVAPELALQKTLPQPPSVTTPKAPPENIPSPPPLANNTGDSKPTETIAIQPNNNNSSKLETSSTSIVTKRIALPKNNISTAPSNSTIDSTNDSATNVQADTGINKPPKTTLSPQPTTPPETTKTPTSLAAISPNELPPIPPKSIKNETNSTNISSNNGQNETQTDNSTTTNEPDQITANNNSYLDRVKTYFQKRWKPPTGLKQSLQYRLFLQKNGSLISITPIGKESETYLDRTSMPLINEQFVSGLDSDREIRLVLNPDGTVQTFNESNER
jgi:hypothetical protein